MGMRIGAGRRGAIGEMNITPMIDVLLVLLVIFMVLQTAVRIGPELHVPPPAAEAERPADPSALVLEIAPGGAYTLNRQPVAGAELEETIRREFAGRARRVLFVRADPAITYGELVHAVDVSVSSGVELVGLAP